MITLDGIVLPDVVIDAEFSFTGVTATVETSLAGNPIIWESEVSGRAIDLKGGKDTAWITRGTLRELVQLAAVPGAVMILDYEGTPRRVRFRFEEQPVVNAVPLVGRPNHVDGDFYHSLYIKLREEE